MTGLVLSPRAQSDLVPRIADGFTNVLALQLSEWFEILPNDPRNVEQNVGALTRGEASPALNVGLLRPFDPFVHVGFAGCGNFAEDFLGGRVHLKNRLGAASLAGFAVEEKLAGMV